MTDKQRDWITGLYNRGFDIAMDQKRQCPWIYGLGFAAGYLEGHSEQWNEPITDEEAVALVSEALDYEQWDELHYDR